MPERPARRRGRDRGRALLQAQGRRLLGDHPRGGQEHRVGQERAGRLHASPSSWCARSTSRIPSATSSARSARPSWPRSSRRSTRRRWILKNYLNDVPFGTVEGRTAIGIEAAAETFFNKHAKDLDLAEAALLAGLPQAPSQYNPFRNPTAALQRRGEVLQKMVENKMHHARRRPTRPSPARSDLRRGTRYTRRREPYFFDYVQEKLIEEYGVSVYRRGGLKVHTTIDPKLQDAARQAIQGQLPNPSDPSSAHRLDRPDQRLHPRDGLERHLQGPPLQPRRPGPPPARLGVQDVGADHRDPARASNPSQHHLHLEAAQPERPRLRAVEGQDLRQHLRRLDEPRARHAVVRQHRLRAADHRRRARAPCARRRS